MNKIKVIELDQWSAGARNLKTIPFDQLTLDKLKGGDSEAAKAIFGGTFRILEVTENQRPSLGNVWFKKDENGFPEFYKAQYDSSD